MEWFCKTFETLTNTELYSILQLRSRVFVVEQNCVYLDTDNKDEKALHLFGLKDNAVAAYARLLPPGLAFREASIGRVVTNPDHRKEGFGRKLMQEAILKTKEHFHVEEIRIGAQLYLKKFYGSLGFVQDSDVYLEDDIEHIEMILVSE